MSPMLTQLNWSGTSEDGFGWRVRGAFGAVATRVLGLRGLRAPGFRSGSGRALAPLRHTCPQSGLIRATHKVHPHGGSKGHVNDHAAFVRRSNNGTIGGAA